MNEFWRVPMAGVVLVLAAVVVTMSGGAGLGGRLGALFGLHSKQGNKPASAVPAAAPAAARVAVASMRVASRTPPPSRARPKSRTRPRSAPGPRRSPAQGEAPRPAPAQQPVAPSPPTPPPPPVPKPTGNVERVVGTVRDTAAPVAPPAQPVLDQTVQTANQVCGMIGGCP